MREILVDKVNKARQAAGHDGTPPEYPSAEPDLVSHGFSAQG